MKYPKEYLEEIKTRLKVSTVVSKSVSLKKRGKEYVGLSPFKTEKTPSFTFKWKLPCHNGVNFLERSCSSEGLVSSTDIWASYTPDCLKGACPWISIRGWDDTDVC